MQSQQQSLARSDSPFDSSASQMVSHLHQDNMFSIHVPQNGMFLHTNGVGSAHHYQQDHLPADLDAGKQQGQLHDKLNGFNYRNFNAFPNTTASRSRHPTTSSILPPNNTYRDPSCFYPSPSENFSSQIGSPAQSHMHNFEGRPSLELNTNTHKHYFTDSFSSPSGLAQHQIGKNNVSQQPNLFSTQSSNFTNGVSLTSQTPYGPHVPAPTSAAVPSASNGVPPSLSANMNTAANPPTTEEISTIFVVGFPEDMQEREFQNMFTFSPGFEAATLKIPNKEYTAYGLGPNGQTGIRPGVPGYQGYGGANDPYNLVTVNQGGVVVDGGRDGTMSSWQAPNDDGTNGGAYIGGGNAMPPRKQIIGFAKFRTREEALAARDVLQGRRVDIEKGAVLKAEMAKKNLHTKRGVGPIAGNQAVNPPPVSAVNPTSFQQSILNGAGLGSSAADMYSLGNEPIMARERQQQTFESMGLGAKLAQWRDPIPQDPIQLNREEEDRRANILNAMGLGPVLRGPRERAEEEQERRRRLRASTLSPYDAFHSVPAASPAISRQSSKNSSLISPDTGVSLHNPLHSSGYTSHRPREDSLVGPWDHLAKSTPRPVPASQRDSPPPSDDALSFSPPPGPLQEGILQHIHSESSASSVTGSQTCGSDTELARQIGVLSVNTTGGKTSPQLPSPASGASTGSSSTRNGIDQNPPINTLYVGNLPNSPPATGSQQDNLENRLRDLFSSYPGFRRLNFRQKNNGPMCFVEFEDVKYATKAMNDLSGNTLSGLVKNGGIRLSYSKNPLGVRSQASAGVNGPSTQQQQTQSAANMAYQQGNGPLSVNTDIFKTRLQFVDDPPSATLRRDSVASPTSNTQSFNNFMISPPPRFTSSSSSVNAYGISPSASMPLIGASVVLHSRRYNIGNSPNGSGAGNNNAISSFGLSSPHSSIPDPSTEDHLHYMHRAMSPPGNNLEATRAG